MVVPVMLDCGGDFNSDTTNTTVVEKPMKLMMDTSDTSDTAHSSTDLTDPPSPALR